MTGLPVSASPAPERDKLLTIIREHTHRHMPASWAADEIERLFASRLAPEPAAEATPAEIGDGYDSLRDLLEDELPPVMPGYETFADRLRLVTQRQRRLSQMSSRPHDRNSRPPTGEREMSEQLKPRLVLLSGLPRSGKTTHARGLGHPIVCPDAIRLALHGQRFVASAEPYIWAIAQTMVHALFLAGNGYVTLDATNLTKKRRDMWYSDDWSTEWIIVNTKMEECLRRAEAAEDWQIIPVIRRMAQETDIDVIHVEAATVVPPSTQAMP